MHVRLNLAVSTQNNNVFLNLVIFSLLKISRIISSISLVNIQNTFFLMDANIPILQNKFILYKRIH